MAIPDASLPGYAVLREKIEAALFLAREGRDVEFKESAPWEILKWKIIRTCLGMANLRDGGILIIGVSERGESPQCEGVAAEHLSTYDPDVVIDQVNRYASPPVELHLTTAEGYCERPLLVIEVKEFGDSPIVCRRGNDGNLEAGTFYVRPRGKAQTTRIRDAADLHDPLERATEKRLHRMLGTVTRAGGSVVGARNQYDDELGELGQQPVLNHPHWMVTFRPMPYIPERLESLKACREAILKHKVRLRGWDYPHLPANEEHHEPGANWFGVRTRDKEYWRFYQSGQFLHLFAVREATWSDWKEQLEKVTRQHLSHYESGVLDKIKGYVSIINLLHTATEVFEFASRLTRAGVYSETIEIRITLTGIQGFALTTEWARGWHHLYMAQTNKLEKIWAIDCMELANDAATPGREATAWFYQRFGWLNATDNIFKQEQEEFLAGHLSAY